MSKSKNQLTKETYLNQVEDGDTYIIELYKISTGGWDAEIRDLNKNKLIEELGTFHDKDFAKERATKYIDENIREIKPEYKAGTLLKSYDEDLCDLYIKEYDSAEKVYKGLKLFPHGSTLPFEYLKTYVEDHWLKVRKVQS